MKRNIKAQSSRPVQTKRNDKKKPQDTLPVSNLPAGSLMNNVTAQPELNIPVQPKLTLGQVGDKYEQEADQVAHDVVQQINTPVQKQEEEKATVQRKPESALSALKADVESVSNEMFDSAVQRQTQLAEQQSTSPQFETALNKTLGQGQSLDEKTQTQMGNAMGADFSGVTIHQDAKADVLCDSIGARAFTTGNDVYFKQGEYQPNNMQGQELLAHELTHVVQQGQGQVQMMVQREPLKPALAKKASEFNITWSELHEYSKTEWTDENIDFLAQCETYDNAPSVGMMSLIYENYVKVGSRKEINVASQNRLDVKNAVETELAKPRDQRQALPGIFDACQKEIYFVSYQIILRLKKKKQDEAQEQLNIVMSNLEAMGM